MVPLGPVSRGTPQLTTGNRHDDSLESLRDRQFDVFLSFAEEDERFAEEVRLRLVENAGVRVFVPSAGESWMCV